MIDVQIVDDHKMTVEGLSRKINESGVARVTAEYYDLKSCREGLSKGIPDVLLLDVDLSDGNGVDFCAEVKKNCPELQIIILTGFKEFNIARHALHNGALGYILKNGDAEEVLAGIEAVSRGEQFLCEEIDILLKDKEGTKTIWLSNREKEILKYMAEGHTSQEIARLIFRDVETVRSCRRSLLVKLEAKNVAELIKKGIEMKLI
jgi:DNA-binding NarL/FixJ family response regulator